MELQRHEGELEEARYNPETLGKVTALAQRLQSRHDDTLTAREMEVIGGEVGLEPAFIRKALAHLTEKPAGGIAVRRAHSPEMAKGVSSAWWAAGWTLPLILAIISPQYVHGAITGALFFLGWAIYIAGGTILSSWSKGVEESQAPSPLSRATLLEMLFALQRQLEGQKQPRAFLSLDVVSSTDMKRDVSELAVEHSFGQFRAWVERIVCASGGEMQSAAGDGVMCVFSTQGAAVRAARRLLLELPAFNADVNRLPSPFRIRSGVSAGEVAIESGTPLGSLHSAVIDRAAALQRSAEPNSLVLGSEVAPAGLKELDHLDALPEPVAGDRAFSWRPTEPPSLS